MAVVDKQAGDLPLRELAAEFFQECTALAEWWLHCAQDRENGGFWGEIARDNLPRRDAPKAVVLNARILWFFSELALQDNNPEYLAAAQRAFVYIQQHFVDPEHGGVYWMLNSAGAVVDGRKHTYAQAFAIYGFSTYYQLSRDEAALESALMCFDRLETYARDRHHGGYFEACSQDWGPLLDGRLSEKEDNSPKTMNTNLHLLEAFSELATAMPVAHPRRTEIFSALADMLAIYCEHVVDMQTGHVRVFMSDDWQNRSHTYSFGHDIESSWLIDKAIEVVMPLHPEMERYRVHARRLADIAFTDGLLPGKGLADEYDIASGEYSRSAWWVQAEAMVGFANRWAHGEGEHYLHAALSVWRHVQQSYLDRENGEWLWYAQQDIVAGSGEYKAGAWKAPYHNGRAMLLMGKLLSQTPYR